MCLSERKTFFFYTAALDRSREEKRGGIKVQLLKADKNNFAH